MVGVELGDILIRSRSPRVKMLEMSHSTANNQQVTYSIPLNCNTFLVKIFEELCFNEWILKKN